MHHRGWVGIMGVCVAHCFYFTVSKSMVRKPLLQSQLVLTMTIGVDNAECIFDDVCNKPPAGTMGARQSRGDLAASGSMPSLRSRPARCRAVEPPSETSSLTEVPTSRSQSPLGWTLKYQPIEDRPPSHARSPRPPKLGAGATADSKPDGTHT